MKQITLVSATFGSLDIVVKEHPDYPNTLKIGNKWIDFGKIIPETMLNMCDLDDDYHIIIWDGMMPHVKIVIGYETYSGTLNIPIAPQEELLAY